MGQIILITGAARSGKSSFALKLSKKFNGKKIFIATAIPIDEEMKERIRKHKKQRKKEFVTIEEPYNLSSIINNIDKNYSLAIIDCITVWLGNIFYRHNNNSKKILNEINILLNALKNIKKNIILVTNEVGWGIVPENKISRLYSDIAGNLNKKLAILSKEVYVLFCGIPLKIKG